jgi:hypothetical protein
VYRKLDLSPLAVKKSLKALAANCKPRIPEPLLADVILSDWGLREDSPSASAKPRLRKAAARA